MFLHERSFPKSQTKSFPTGANGFLSVSILYLPLQEPFWDSRAGIFHVPWRVSSEGKRERGIILRGWCILQRGRFITLWVNGITGKRKGKRAFAYPDAIKNHNGSREDLFIVSLFMKAIKFRIRKPLAVFAQPGLKDLGAEQLWQPGGSRGNIWLTNTL